MSITLTHMNGEPIGNQKKKVPIHVNGIPTIYWNTTPHTFYNTTNCPPLTYEHNNMTFKYTNIGGFCYWAVDDNYNEGDESDEG